MKYTRTLMAAAAALMIAGCGPTMPVKADAEQAPQEPAVVMPQGPVGIPVKVGETSIKPFLVTLGTPAKEAKRLFPKTGRIVRLRTKFFF